jgi:hypothetical protein
MDEQEAEQPGKEADPSGEDKEEDIFMYLKEYKGG